MGGPLTRGGMCKGLLSRCAPRVEQTEVGADLGALCSRLGKRGRVVRRSWWCDSRARLR
jgi:hypothetical protein